jgi:deoxycytidine triphosphate deaminase
MTLDLKPIRTRGDSGVPHLVAGTKLRDAVAAGTFIQSGDVASVEGVKYDFHMGNRILKASYTQPVNVDRLSEADQSNLCVDPGEVVFVLTKETLNLPKNMMAVLSPKRTLAHAGIMVLGGLMVDPNYSGVLWVGLYNFSSNSYPIRPGRKLIAAMFYELEGDEIQDFPTPDGEADFPDALIDLIKHYRPIELKGIQDELRETQRQLLQLRDDVQKDEGWRSDFKIALDAHNSQIEKILMGLETEKENRVESDKRIETKLDNLTGLFGGGKAILALILIVITIAATLGAERLFGK